MLAKGRSHAHQFGKFGVVTRANKTQQPKDEEDRKSNGCVAPDTAKGLREFLRREVANPFAPLGVGPVNATMGTDHKTVEVIDQTWISRFCSSNSQVRRGTPVNST